MAFFYYASFPNSRLRNRTPTRLADTYLVAVANNTLPLVRVAENNENRTYIILTNTSDTITMRYLYPIEAPGVNPTVTPTFGVKNQVLYDTAGNLLYAKLDDGFNTNWVLTTPGAVAEYVLPFQNASLETLGDIYAFADDPVTGLTVALDEGRG